MELEQITNVDHLFRNYSIAEITLAKQKLRNDVEKKQNELKQLIGERYNELYHATDSFNNMNSTIAELIGSINEFSMKIEDLNRRNNDDDKNLLNNQSFDDDNRRIYEKFAIANVHKFVFDLPLKIWNYLNENNFLLATFAIYYGQYLGNQLQLNTGKPQSLNCDKILTIRLNLLKHLKNQIIYQCWQQISTKSIENDIDLDEFCLIFSYLIILKQNSSIVHEFLSKQMENIDKSIENGQKISTLLGQILNIIKNTMKCMQIFKNTDGNFNLKSRLNEICTENYVHHAIDGTMVKYWPKSMLNYTIGDHFSLQPMSQESADSMIKDWLRKIKENFSVKIESKFQSIGTINELSSEIQPIECYFHENDSDFHRQIWSEWLLSIYESRIYEIVDLKLHQIQLKFIESTLSPLVIDQSINDKSLNILDFIWNNHSSHESPIKTSNQFNNLIDKTCRMFEESFSRLFIEDIEIIIMSNGDFLAQIHRKIIEFFHSICKLIDNNTVIVEDHNHDDHHHLQQQQQHLNRKLLLFGSILFKRTPLLCKSLMKIFVSNTNQSKWNEILSIFNDFNDNYLLKLFQITIEERFEALNSKHFVEIDEFLRNFSQWQTIVIKNSVDQSQIKSNEDGKSLDDDDQPAEASTTTTTTIEIPIQISLEIYELLYQISMDINRFCSYFVTSKLLLKIIEILGRYLIEFYSKIIDDLCNNHEINGQDDIFRSTKQIQSIQLYYDLIFLKQLFLQKQSHQQPQTTTIIDSINQLMIRLETDNIDPFDLHLIQPYLNFNSRRLQSSYRMTFGYLLFDSAISNDNQSLINDKSLLLFNDNQQSSSSVENQHNLMLSYCCTSSLNLNLNENFK